MCLCGKVQVRGDGESSVCTVGESKGVELSLMLITQYVVLREDMGGPGIKGLLPYKMHFVMSFMWGKLQWRVRTQRDTRRAGALMANTDGAFGVTAGELTRQVVCHELTNQF